MGTFEPALLPDAEKERLVRMLLAEFGVTNVRVTTEGEMIHSCPLPFGAHANGDRSPSASINYKKLTFNCLGCGNSGGLLWFIGVCRGNTTGQARDWLKEQTGQGPDGYSVNALLKLLDDLYAAGDGKPVSMPIPKMSEQVLKPWEITDPDSNIGYLYLTEMRGVHPQNIVDLKVGFNSQENRVIIPHFWEGRLVGWQSRRLLKDGTPKYLSTPDFPRDCTIYNYERKRKVAVVVESPSSVLRHAHHQPMEATFGAKVTDRQIHALSMHPKIVLWMDNDVAGWAAVEGTYDLRKGKKVQVSSGLGEKLIRYSDVYVVDNPWSADPGDLPDDEVDRLIEQAVPYAFWAKPKEMFAWDPVPV